MRAVIQRCKEASVKVNSEIVGKINDGYMILVGFTALSVEMSTNFFTPFKTAA